MKIEYAPTLYIYIKATKKLIQQYWTNGTKQLQINETNTQHKPTCLSKFTNRGII